MPFPTNEKELVAAGYRFYKKGKCRGPNCGAELEFWDTPNNKLIPLDPGTMIPHFKTCPDAKDFKKGG